MFEKILSRKPLLIILGMLLLANVVYFSYQSLSGSSQSGISIYYMTSDASKTKEIYPQVQKTLEDGPYKSAQVQVITPKNSQYANFVEKYGLSGSVMTVVLVDGKVSFKETSILSMEDIFSRL